MALPSQQADHEEDGKPSGIGRGRTVSFLFGYLWPEGRGDLKIRILIAIALLIAAKVINVWMPVFYKRAVDSFDTTEALLAVPVFLIVAYGVARVSSQVFGELRDAVFAKVQEHAVRSMAIRTFRHLHALSLRFHLERRTGGVSRAIERGSRGIQFVLRFMLFNIIPTLVEIALVAGIMGTLYDWRYAAVTVVTVSIYIFFTVFFSDWRLQFRRKMNKADSDANTKAIDSLLNFETVKYFGNEDHETARFDKAMASYEKAAVKSQMTLSALNTGQGFVIAAGLVIVMLMAGNGVADGTMTVGDFVLVNAYLIQLFMPLNFLGFVYREIKQSLVDMEKMFSLLEVEQEVEDKPDAKDLVVGAGAIRFDNVHFAYDERRPILKGVSFDIPAGHTVAIVGSSGAGKSTLSRLLYRFYDVSEGAITIDGQDIREVSQQSLRAVIGIVPQDTVLFNDSIEYNIGYGRPAANHEEIVEAAKMAQIHDFILEQPDGFHAQVGERGLKLSGGEKQRVAIARTILKDPPVLMFDEATSALDTHTERDIQDALNAVSKDRTTLVIAHRLSTVTTADRIIVLDKGEIAEQGSHDELLTMKGAYAALWSKQQETEETRKKLLDLEKEEAQRLSAEGAGNKAGE